MENFLNMMSNWAQDLVNLLPMSPFRQYIDAFSGLPYLGYINWLIPVGAFIKIGSSWLAVITVYYIYSAILRWVGAID